MKLEELNALGREAFVEAVGRAFEDSPWVAERAWALRPFSALEELCRGMNGVVGAASEGEQLALVRAHPDLGTRAKVSASSETEQASAGLDRLSPDEYERLLGLNTDYKRKFGFPFLYAVKGSSKFDILDALQRRLGGEPEAEFSTALEQVYRIARFRLEEIIQ